MYGKYKTVDTGRSSLENGFQKLIETKRNAAAHSFKPAPEAAENPREVFLTCCESISDALANDGFKFSKSGPHCTRKGGDFSYRIRFSSSHYNVAGEHVALSICGSVHSRKFRKWQVEHNLHNPSDFVTSGQIGYLVEEHVDLRWELADPTTRDEVMEGAILAIRDMAFPFFDRFNDIDAVVGDVTERRFGLMCHHVPIIKFLMFFSGKDAARRYVRRQLSNPSVYEAFVKEYDLYRGEGLFKVLNGPPGKVLASAVHVFDLGDFKQ